MTALRRILVTLCATLGLAGGAVLLPAPAYASLPPTGTGPATGSARATGYPTLVDVRWGAHDSFDRIVFEFTGGTPAYRVAYGTLEHLGSGQRIELAGNADLVVDFETARAHDGNYRSTYPLRTMDPALKTLKQVKWGGDYEGYLRAGLGLRERVGFRVFTLTSPARVVVDMSHRRVFDTTTVTASGTATNVVVDEVRGAKHTGYDRLVLDVLGTAKPGVAVRYASADSSTLLVRLSATGSTPRASYTGPSPVTFGHPALRSVRAADEGGSVLFRVSTAKRTGFRVLLLTSPVRVVVDIRH